MIVRQSMIKAWMECSLRYKYEHIDGLPREQSSALTWGSALHEAVERLETAMESDDEDVRQNAFSSALTWFTDAWAEPAKVLGPEYEIDYYLPRTSWQSLYDEGKEILTRWHGHQQWESDVVLAREYEFLVDVPGTDHQLTGTLDRLSLRYVGKLGRNVVQICDYKTSKKRPTYSYLAHDLQFTAYSFATEQPDFWTDIENGEEIFERMKDAPRHNEWIHLRGPQRLDAGERTADPHYARLIYAINQIADSIALGIFVPDISGATCTFCDFREACGLKSLAEEGYLEEANNRLFEAVNR